MKEKIALEQYKGGGRISPEKSATAFPKGTLGVGNNGDVWLNAEDKNGRLAWKATSIQKQYFDTVNFTYFSDDRIVFYIQLPNFNWVLNYYYDSKSYCLFQYIDFDGNLTTEEISSDLRGCSNFFRENYNPEKFDEFNTDDKISGFNVQAEITAIFNILSHLSNTGKIRSYTDTEIPNPKFKKGDKVTRKKGNQVMTVVKSIYDDNKKMFDYDLVFEDGNEISLFENELELIAETPEPQFQVGDKVVYQGGEIKLIVKSFHWNKVFQEYEYVLNWEDDGSKTVELESRLELVESMWKKLSIKNGNIYIGAKINDKVTDHLFLKTEANEYAIPVIGDDKFFVFGSTLKMNKDLNLTLAVSLDYEKGLSVLLESRVGDFTTVKTENIINLAEFKKTYDRVFALLDQYANNVAVDEVNTFVKRLLENIDENNIMFDWKGSTLKVGDKVILPLTKMGKRLDRYMSKAWDSAMEKNQLFMYVTEVLENGKVALNDKKEEDGDYFNENLDNLVLFNEAYEETPFQQIDFLQPSTEELDVLIKAMDLLSDGLKFFDSQVGMFEYVDDNSIIHEIAFRFNKVDNVIAFSFFDKKNGKNNVEFSKKIGNENILEITQIYIDTFNKVQEKINGKAPEAPKSECEADPSKISDGQVKTFYELNKSRIDKLDSKFSCKIVQALVSLSEYEKCGSPSSATLSKAKSDLLSKISKLKV